MNKDIKIEWGQLQWIHDETRLQCLVKMSPLGGWLGYVGVPSNHKDFGADYSDVNASCAGGLTFSGKREGSLWWLGFDCSHNEDAPGKSIKFVIDETENLAKQLMEQG